MVVGLGVGLGVGVTLGFADGDGVGAGVGESDIGESVGLLVSTASSDLHLLLIGSHSVFPQQNGLSASDLHFSFSRMQHLNKCGCGIVLTLPHSDCTS